MSSHRKRIGLFFWLLIHAAGIGFSTGISGPGLQNIVCMPDIRQVNLVDAVMVIDEEGEFESLLIPLKKAGRLFLIEADVDGTKGNLVFDTGADKLVLNLTYFRKNLTEVQETAGGLSGGMRTINRTRVQFLKATIAGKPVEFCLDTAAETNIISNTAPGKVLETICITNRTELTGVSGDDRDVLRGTMNEFVLGELKCRPMQTIVANLSYLSQAYDYPVSGILGYDFFVQGKISINLVTKEIGVFLNEVK